MRTLTIIATGHSLTKAQVDYVKSSMCDTMVINESFLMAPWADYLIAGDPEWWDKWGQEVHHRFNGELLTVDKKSSEKPPYPKFLEGSNRENSAGGLCKTLGHVYYGGNSGHVALTLAYQYGYEKVVLLGFDLHGGHWFKESFRPPGIRRESPLEHFNNTLSAIIKDLQEENILVYNCTPGSKLSALPYTPLEDVL